MRVLFITHRCPYPPNRGDSIRSFHILQRLAQMGEVCLATLCDQPLDDEGVGELDSLCERTIIVRWGGFRKWCRTGISFFMGKTMTEGLFHNAKLRAEIEILAREKPFDLVVVFCSSMVQYLNAIPTEGGKPKIVVDLVDVDSQKWFDYSARSRGWKKFLFRLEGQRLRRLEGRIADECDALLAVTPEEVKLYESFRPGANIHACPNGVDLEYFHPDSVSEAEIPGRCVFVGALDYRANVDGVEWFARNVLPEVRKRNPDCEFDVVGSRPGPGLKILEKETPGFHLIGTVPDVRPYLKRASLVVVPLQVARGIQNKVLEGCAMRKAVLASVSAAEGIQRLTTEDFGICDSPEDWIEKVCRLLNEAQARAKMGVSARNMVETLYGWDARLNKMETIIRRV